MRFTAAAAAAGLAATATASVMGHHDNSTMTVAPEYVTEIVTAYTTYCPEATKITHAGETYTVSEATTLTITNCPGGCTVTKPVYSSLVTSCSTCSSSSAVEVHPIPAETISAVETHPVPVESTTAVETHPVATSAVETAPVYTTPMVSSSMAAPVYPMPSSNGTTTAYPTGTAAPSASSSTGPVFDGSASKASVAGMGFFGLIAFAFAL